MKSFFGFAAELEFFIKVASSCVIFQALFSLMLPKNIPFLDAVLLFWGVGLIAFYGIGFLIERVLKANPSVKQRLNIRIAQVKPQTYPAIHWKGFLISSIQSLIFSFVILASTHQVPRSENIFLNFGWFLMSIIVADFCFYVAHRTLHSKRFIRIHVKHHEFKDSSSFVAGHKSFTESCITTVTDLLPIFIFGYDIHQLLAWVVVGTAYNLEGHSALSIFFIHSDFHDKHHTHFKGNYGVQGFWDRIFNTLQPAHKNRRWIFLANFLEQKLTRK